MSWVEQEQQGRKKLTVTEERAALLDKVKAEALPPIRHEVANGDKPFEPIRFQPVRSPGLFEAEFAKKEDDVIFHFWPWGLHEAERSGKPRPPFSKNFRDVLQKAFKHSFGADAELSEDRDMGAWFVKVRGLGRKQFWHDLSVKAATLVHTELGGDKG